MVHIFVYGVVRSLYSNLDTSASTNKVRHNSFGLIIPEGKRKRLLMSYSCRKQDEMLTFNVLFDGRLEQF